MEKKHVSFTKDGMKVEYKQVNDEDYASAQQRYALHALSSIGQLHGGDTDRSTSYLVKAWNYSSLPNYKSRFWNKDEQARQAALAKQGKASGSDAAAR